MRIKGIGGGKLDGHDNRGRVIDIKCCIISALHMHFRLQRQPCPPSKLVILIISQLELPYLVSDVISLGSPGISYHT